MDAHHPRRKHLRNARKTGICHRDRRRRGLPPEDVGGPPGYIEFLDTNERRPRSQEAREMLDWAGGAFDAKLFDKRAANAALLRMALNGWGKK